jgi:RNA polymerase-binding transcription factor DksA
VTEQTSGTGLSSSEKTAVQDQLAAERESTTVQVAALTREFDAVEASTSVATDDEHDPEGSTIAFERAQVAALLSQARSHLVDLDRALERLRDGTYGTCERCGQPITSERLAARPAARTCIRCAAARTR